MKQVYKPAQIVRAIMVATGKGTEMFNDSIGRGANKGRSIKVWNWNRDCYETAKQALEHQGYTVTLVTTPVRGSQWSPGGELRLHVTGNPR